MVVTCVMPRCRGFDTFRLRGRIEAVSRLKFPITSLSVTNNFMSDFVLASLTNN
ncbi:hypothetical protein YC2023_057638 [Brassica napus]